MTYRTSSPTDLAAVLMGEDIHWVRVFTAGGAFFIRDTRGTTTPIMIDATADLLLIRFRSRILHLRRDDFVKVLVLTSEDIYRLEGTAE